MSNWVKSTVTMPKCRQNFGCAEWAGKIYCMGGYYTQTDRDINASEILTNTVVVYDIASATWSSVANMPNSLYNVEAVAYNGKIYCIGGQSSTPNYYTIGNSVYIYDIASDSWSSGANMPKTKMKYGVALVGDRIYCIGGTPNYSSSYNTYYTLCTDVCIYSITNNRWSYGVDIPSYRYGISCAVSNGKIYCLGGADKWGTLLSTFEVFDTNTGKWSTLPNSPTYKFMAKSFALGNKIYSTFGCSGGDEYNTDSSMLIYDIPSSTWYAGQYGGEGGFSNGVVLYKDTIYEMGGMGWNDLYSLVVTNAMYSYLIDSSDVVPFAPTVITFDKQTVITGDEITVTWNESPSTNISTKLYDLYFYNGKKWMPIFTGTSNLTYTYTIPTIAYNTEEARFKVRVSNGTKYSDFLESSTFTITKAIGEGGLETTPDEDLGNLSKGFTVEYSIDDLDEGDTLELNVYLDGDVVFTDSNAERGKSYSYTIDDDTWDNFTYGEHYLDITVIDGINITRLTYTFTKPEPKVYYPTISGHDTNLGMRDFPFVQTYTVDDEDNARILTVLVKLDNATIIDTINNAVRGNKYSIDMSSYWDGLSKGVHKISIIVSDDIGYSTTRVYNFYKGSGTNHPPTITLLG